jgi:hypothetical protein
MKWKPDILIHNGIDIIIIIIIFIGGAVLSP